MGVVKDFRFPVSVELERGRTTRVTVTDKPRLRVAPPPEFRGAAGLWSPEDLLVASAATCYAVTLAAVAERRLIPIHELAVSGMGHVSQRQDGRLGFVAIELDVRLRTRAEHVEAAERAARRAEQACLITMALDVPVHVTAVVEAVEPVPV